MLKVVVVKNHDSYLCFLMYRYWLKKCSDMGATVSNHMWDSWGFSIPSWGIWNKNYS